MSSTLISILVSAVLAVFLLISFFVGFKRGAKRSLLNGGFAFIGIILAFFLTPIITNAFMSITLEINGEKVTAGTAVSELLMSNEQIGTYVTNSESLQAFLNGIVPALCAIVIYILLCLIFKLIMFLIYAIVAHFAVKKKDEKGNKIESKGKVMGGVLSVVKSFLFILALFLPLTSLTGLVEEHFFSNYAAGTPASAVSDNKDSGLPSTEEISNEIPSDVKKIIAGYNRSAIGWCSNLFGLDNVCFDYLSRVDVNGETICIRQAADEFFDFYNYIVDVLEAYNEGEENYFASFDYEELDKYMDSIVNSTMFKGLLLDVVCDYVQNYEVVLEGTDFLKNNKELLGSVKTYITNQEKPNEALSSDILKLLEIFETLGKSGFVDDILSLEEASTEKIISLLTNDYKESFIDAFDALFDVGFIDSSYSSLVEKLNGEFGENSDIINFSILANDEVRDEELAYISNILSELSNNKLETQDGEQSFLLYIMNGNGFEGIFDSMTDEDVESLITPILKSRMTTSLCDTIFGTIESTMEDITSDTTISISYSREDNQTQIPEICDIFKEFLNVYGEDFTSVSDIPYAKAGALLDTLKINAYGKDGRKNGIFKTTFDALVNKSQDENEFTFTELTNKENIYDINFTGLFSFVEVLDSDTSGFSTAIKELMKEGGMTVDNIKGVFESITNDNSAKVIEILYKAYEQGISIDTSEITGIDVEGVEKTLEEAIETDSLYKNFTIATEADRKILDNIQLGLTSLLR